MEKFDWNTHCGSIVSPRAAVEQARRLGETFREYAEGYLAQYPRDFGQPPDDLVDGMVAEMDRADASA